MSASAEGQRSESATEQDESVAFPPDTPVTKTSVHVNISRGRSVKPTDAFPSVICVVSYLGATREQTRRRHT